MKSGSPSLPPKQSELAPDSEWVDVSHPTPDQDFVFIASPSDLDVRSLPGQTKIIKDYIPKDGSAPSPRSAEMQHSKIPVYTLTPASTSKSETSASVAQAETPALTLIGMAEPTLYTPPSPADAMTKEPASPARFTARLKHERQANQANQSVPASVLKSRPNAKKRTVIFQTGGLGGTAGKSR